jgi:TRAP-type uncharacterized transport system substrate-binding protein
VRIGTSGNPGRYLILLAGALALHAFALDATGQVKMLTGEDASDLRMGRDLAEFIASPAGVRLDVVPSPSSPENLGRLRTEPGVNLAVVQGDVYRAFLAQRGRGGSAPPPRMVLLLPDKEIHFVARADAPFEFLHQIANARINVGPSGSGTAATVKALYRLMFGKALPSGQMSSLSPEEALVKLVTDKSVDVVAIAAEQPAALIAGMKPEARQYIKLLAFDPRQPESRAALREYSRSTLRVASYPVLLAKEVPVLAVKMYLVTLDFRDDATETRLIRFGRSLCRNFPELQAKGHPKWREVEPRLVPLPDGWQYYPPTRDELRHCHAAAHVGAR